MLYHGALASAFATFAGHAPWFGTCADPCGARPATVGLCWRTALLTLLHITPFTLHRVLAPKGHGIHGGSARAGCQRVANDAALAQRLLLNLSAMDGASPGPQLRT